MTANVPDALYGLAPVERDVVNGVVYMTMVGLMKRLDISESTLRRNVGLMALRKVLGPNTYRWMPADVDAYVREQTPQPVGTPAQRKHRLHKKTGGSKHRKEAIRRDTALTDVMREKMDAYYKTRSVDHGID